MKLKNKNPKHANQIITLPLVGDTLLDKDASFETEDKALVKLLTEKSSDWELLGVKGKAEVDKKALKKKVVVEEEEEETEEEEEEDELNMEKLSLEELIEIAVEADYDEAEYKKYKNNKKLMIIYLSKKAKE